jgi:hypothetical protein
VNPANPGAWNLRGALLERSDSPTAAARCYAEAARLLDSHSAALQHCTATAAADSSDSSGSVAAARRAVVANWVRALTAAGQGEAALTVLADAAAAASSTSSSSAVALEQGRALMAGQRWSEAAAVLSAAAAAAASTVSCSSEAATTAAAATAAACAHYFVGDHAAAVTAATELVQAVPLLVVAVGERDLEQYWSSLMVGLCLGGLCSNIGLAQVNMLHS